MSFVIAVPEALTMAASDLANIGSTINAANAAAALPTTGVVAAAADEVSAAVAALFGSYAQSYQAFGAQLSAFHAQFVQSLTNGARSYVVAEATSAAPLQDLLGVVNAPAQALLGRPLIGNGANGADGTGAPGGPGGLLLGNGGNGGSGAPRRGAVAGGPGGGCGIGRDVGLPLAAVAVSEFLLDRHWLVRWWRPRFFPAARPDLGVGEIAQADRCQNAERDPLDAIGQERPGI